jgi:hypothetical protein
MSVESNQPMNESTEETPQNRNIISIIIPIIIELILEIY